MLCLKWEQNVYFQWVRECSPDTCNNRLASIRTFLKYLGSRDASYLYLYQEASEIPRRKCTKKKVKGMSRLAVKSLLAAPDLSEKTARRDLAFIILLYSTAARLDEILSMKNEQLHLIGEKPYATVIGKGNKIRSAALELFWGLGDKLPNLRQFFIPSIQGIY